ncbi:MAG: hypothetical protein WCL50_08100 [Spirochaetota bacterium]
MEVAAHGRGACPDCKREGMRVVYEQEVEGAKLKICKSTIANKK